MFQSTSLIGLTASLVPSQLPALPPRPAPDADLDRARGKITDIRDHSLMALNHFARGTSPSNPWNMPTTDLLPNGDVNVRNRPYYTQFNIYSNQHRNRTDAFAGYFGAADRTIPGSPLQPGQRPEEVFGSYSETDPALIGRYRAGFVQDRLAALDRAAGAVDRELGAAAAHFENHNPNLGTGIYSGGWRRDTGSAAYALPGNQAMYMRYNTTERRFEYAIGAAGLDAAGQNRLTFRLVTADVPVQLRNPALPATDPANRGSAGMTVDFTDPTTGQTRPLRLVVALADPTKPITDPANREALEASTMIDALRQGKSIRQAVFAANAGTVRARYSAQLTEYYDTNRTEFVTRRAEETRQNNVTLTILTANGRAVYGDPPAVGQPRPLLYYEIPGNPNGASTRAVWVRQREGSWEFVPKPDNGIVPPNGEWTRLNAPNAVTSYAPAVAVGASTEVDQIRTVLGKIRDRQATPLTHTNPALALPAVTAAVEREATDSVIALRLVMRGRFLNNSAFGFVPVPPNPATAPVNTWTLNTGDVRVEVRVEGNGLQYRMQSRNADNQWGAWDPPGNGPWRPMPASEVVIPSGEDGARNPVAVQQAYVNNLLFRIGRSTRLDQDLPTIRRELADVDATATRLARMGNSGDPARDLLEGVYGAERVGPPAVGQPEPYGPGVLRLTVGPAGPGQRIILLRRQTNGQASTGFGLWEAATVPASGAPQWRPITPGNQAATWITPLGLTADERTTTILRQLTRFNYSTPFNYGDPSATPRTAPFNPIVQPIRDIVFDPERPNQRRDESARQGELLIRSTGIAYDPAGTNILAAARFNPATGGPAEVRMNSTTKLWEVRYGGAAGTWVVCGRPGSFPTGTSTDPAAQREITAATRIIYLLGEMNQASEPPPR